METYNPSKVEDEPIIVIDTREQNPFFKRPPKGIITVRSKLDYGDYSIKGFENLISIERKSSLDFLSSITKERKRFKKELESLSKLERHFIVIESSLKDILKPQSISGTLSKKKKGTMRPFYKTYSKVNNESVYQTIVSISIRYNTMFYFGENRRDAEKFTLSVLLKYYKLKREGVI